MRHLSIIYFIFLFLVFSGCTSGDLNSAIPNVDDFKMISIEEAYPIAKEEANNWDQENYIDSIYIDVIPKSVNRSLYVTFSFRSAEDPDIFLLIWISNIDGVFVIEKTIKDKFPLGRPDGMPIIIEELTVSSQDAFSLFYENYGREFYQNNHQINYPHTLKLQQEIPAKGEGGIIWQITFSSVDDALSVSVDAETGEIVEVRGQ